MRVLVTGATGFVGRAVVDALRGRSDEIVLLTQRAEHAARLFGESVRCLSWRDRERGAWREQLGGFDAVVHLAGSRAVGVRYTGAVKREIAASRIETTKLLAGALATLEPAVRPKLLLSASAVGYYGSGSLGAPMDESSPCGRGFLADVCRKWEAAALGAASAGIRVVTARFGIVLGAGGGALEAMKRPFLFGVGGPIGEGRQPVSWIHLHDLVRSLLWTLEHQAIEGAMNVTSPEPVDNAALSRALGKALGRRSWLRAPAGLLRLALGEGAEPLLEGQAVLPRVLERSGFVWDYPELSLALRDILHS